MAGMLRQDQSVLTECLRCQLWRGMLGWRHITTHTDGGLGRSRGHSYNVGMNILSPDGIIPLNQFDIYFRHRIRRATMNIANDGASEDECMEAYAKHITESFETVKRVATIKGEQPTQNILNRLGLMLGPPHYLRPRYEK